MDHFSGTGCKRAWAAMFREPFQGTNLIKSLFTGSNVKLMVDGVEVSSLRKISFRVREQAATHPSSKFIDCNFDVDHLSNTNISCP